MSIYRNSFFKLQIVFSEQWYLRSWSNWKRQPKSVAQYQCSDDDVPADDKGYKALFKSHLLIKGSPALMSCELSMETHWREGKFELQASIAPHSAEISRSFTVGRISGVDSQILTIEQYDEFYVRHRQIVMWQAYPNIWLSACVSGDTPDNFEAAKLQFNKLKRF